MKENKNLPSCPFCGYEDVEINTQDVFPIIIFMCEKCNAVINFMGTEYNIEKAIKAYSIRDKRNMQIDANNYEKASKELSPEEYRAFCGDFE